MVEDSIAKETDGKTEAVPVESEAKLLFSVPILRLIRDAQKQHGLRHGDYQRYRGTTTLITLPFKTATNAIKLDMIDSFACFSA